LDTGGARRKDQSGVTVARRRRRTLGSRHNTEAAKTKEVSKTFTAGDWIIELDLYSGGSNSEPAARAVRGSSAARAERSREEGARVLFRVPLYRPCPHHLDLAARTAFIKAWSHRFAGIM